ncbi:hypothetical protein H072_3071 [Dactylellina haptotyla CBS 200.50]|uniref:Uncharacterized protein n=1 Tax=Dactylellina haptotyla (strain CBS 200.50) TaxID=1284197 RepID=S8AJ55_DACHA|nr:hypothetical protein H072_3071 [Dactylellina haptotyla CBS 200.50]
MEELKSICLRLGIPIAVAINRLYELKEEVHFANLMLEDLIRDFKDTRRQLSNLRGFLEEAELDTGRRNDCTLLVHDLHRRVNKLTNLTECIIMKLKQRNPFRRAKSRLSLVNSDLKMVQETIGKINSGISSLRQEMMLSIMLDTRSDIRTNHETVKKDLETIQRNTMGTDAKRIRKIYKENAIRLMYDPFHVGCPSSEAQVMAVEDIRGPDETVTQITITEITLPIQLTTINEEPLGPSLVREINAIIDRRSLSQNYQHIGLLEGPAELP